MVNKKRSQGPRYYETDSKSVMPVLLMSFFLTVSFFIAWRIYDSPWCLWIFLVTVFISIAFLRPVISKRRLCIEKGNITFLHRIGSPLTVNIAESLYEVVVRGDEIRSFRFKAEKRRIQVSPEGYKDGDNLLKEIKDVIRKNKITVRVIEI